MVVLIKWFAAQFVKEGEFFFRGRLHSNSTEELLYKFKECQALHTLASFYVGIGMISLNLFLGPFKFMKKSKKECGELVVGVKPGLTDIGG